MSAVAVAAAAGALFSLHGHAMLLSTHMVAHAVAMNIAAPLACLALGLRQASSQMLGLAAVMQITLLFAWHTPMLANANATAMHLSLAGAAVWFWASALTPHRTPLLPIVALLVTGKLVCFGGLLLLLADDTFRHNAQGGIADQQLAGLVMLTTCALSYVTAAVWIFWRWLVEPAGPLETAGASS